MHPCSDRPGRRQRGFSLLEVLVAFLILSVGLIGLAGLQLGGVQSSRDAYFSTQAVILAQTIADSMRANLDAVDDGDFNNGTATQTEACRTSAGCSTRQMARNDLFDWNQYLSTLLPSGEGVVCRDSSPYDGTGAAGHQCDNNGVLYAVKVWWDDDRDPATAKRILVTVVEP